MSLNVTPAGGAAGSRASSAAVHGSPSRPDPFGSRPTERRRGWIRIVVGGALLVGGIGATLAGIVAAVGQHERITADAVARGTVSAGGGELLAFRAPPGARRDYTVYVHFDGLTSNTTVRELAVRDTGCTVLSSDGERRTFRGARQGVSTTLGDLSSVGHFRASAGTVRLTCAYTSGTWRSQRRRPEVLPYVITPGTPSVASGGVLLIVGGVFAALGGGFLVGWGWRRRRPVR